MEDKKITLTFQELDAMLAATWCEASLDIYGKLASVVSHSDKKYESPKQYELSDSRRCLVDMILESEQKCTDAIN